MNMKDFVIELTNMKIRHRIERFYFIGSGFGLVFPMMLGPILYALDVIFFLMLKNPEVAEKMDIYPFYLFLFSTPIILYAIIRVIFFSRILDLEDFWKPNLTIEVISDGIIKHFGLKTKEDLENYMWLKISGKIKSEIFRIKYLLILPYITFAVTLFIYLRYLI